MKSVSVVILAAALLASVPAFSYAQDVSGPEKAKMFVEQGMKFLQANNAQMARQCFMRALEADKGNFEANLYLGLTLRMEQNWGGAAAKFQDAVKANPNHQQARYYFGATLMKLGRPEQALEHLEGATKATEGFFTDQVMSVLVPYEYGKCLALLGKGKESAPILQPLADGGKFEMFGSMNTEHRPIFYQGYLATGEAFSALGLYAEADKYFSRAVQNVRMINEGNISRDAWEPFRINKHRVLIASMGQIDGDIFFSPSHKIKIKKPSGYDFIFHHPECYQNHPQAEALYKQESQAACLDIWQIHKTKEGEYKAKIRIDLDAWDHTRGGLTIGGKSVSLDAPKNVCDVRLDQWMENWVPENKRTPPITKTKLAGCSAAFWKGTFTHKEHTDVKRDREFWCFVSTQWSFFLDIEADGGALKEKETIKELEMFKRSLQIVK